MPTPRIVFSPLQQHHPPGDVDVPLWAVGWQLQGVWTYPSVAYAPARRHVLVQHLVSEGKAWRRKSLAFRK